MKNAAPSTQAKTRRAKRRNANIRTGIPSGEKTKQLQLPALTRIDDSYVSSVVGSMAGFSVYKLETGDATYRALTFAIKCDDAIAGKTVDVHGLHYIKEELIPDYIDDVRLRANGGNLQEMSAEELRIRNVHTDIDFGPVYTGFAFPGEFTYASQSHTDAFAIGTKGWDDFQLELKPKTAFDPGTMEIVIMPWVVDRVKPAGWISVTERHSTTFPSKGVHTFTGLPVGDDIKSIWVKGEGIQALKLEIDGDTLFDMDYAQYCAFMIEKRRNVEILGGDWFLDVHAERSPRSIAALDRKSERSRDARVKLTVVTTQQSTEVEFLSEYADVYEAVR